MEEIRNLFLELQRIQERCPPRGLAVATIAAILDSCKLNGNNGIGGVPYGNASNNGNNNSNPLALKPPASMLMLQAAPPPSLQTTASTLAVPKHSALTGLTSTVPSAEKQVPRVDKGTSTADCDVSGNSVNIHYNNKPSVPAHVKPFKALPGAVLGESKLAEEEDTHHERSISQLRKCLQNCPVVSSSSAASSAGDLLAAQQLNLHNPHHHHLTTTLTTALDYEEENINADTRSSDLDFANLQLECMCSSDSVASSPTASTYKCLSAGVPEGKCCADIDGSNSNNSMKHTNSAKDSSCSCTTTGDGDVEVDRGAASDGGQVLDASGNGGVISQSARCYTANIIGDYKSTSNGNCQLGATPAGTATQDPDEGVQGGGGAGSGIVVLPKGMSVLQKQQSLNTTMGLMGGNQQRQKRKRECGKTLSCGDVVLGQQCHLEASSLSTSSTVCGEDGSRDFREQLQECGGKEENDTRSSIGEDNSTCPTAAPLGQCRRSVVVQKELMTSTGGCIDKGSRKLNVTGGISTEEEEDSWPRTGNREWGDHQEELLPWKSEPSQQMLENCKYEEDEEQGRVTGGGGQVEPWDALSKKLSGDLSQCLHSRDDDDEGGEGVLSKDPCKAKKVNKKRIDGVGGGGQRPQTLSSEDEKGEVDQMGTTGRLNVLHKDERRRVEEEAEDIAIDDMPTGGSSGGTNKKKTNSSRNSPDAKMVLDLNDKSKYTKEVSV